MSLLGIIITFFPLSIYVIFLIALYWFVVHPCYISLSVLVLIPYLYPLFAFRLINLFFPLKEGVQDLSAKKYNPWWGSYQIQSIYYVFPFLEGILKTIPGVYSLWLRLWGSKVGKGVVWTPNIEICDRPLMSIGDHVVIGHTAMFISHVINSKEGKAELYIKKITLEDRSFVGAGSKFGPGSCLKEGAKTKILTIVTPNQVVEK